MNSCKFRILGLVVTALFITSLMASPNRVGKNPMEITVNKETSSIIKKSDVRAEKVGEVISSADLSSGSALGIAVPTKEGVVLNKTEQSPWRLNDRTDYIVQTEGRPECPDGYVDDCSGDGDCCPESWIGDGFADCEDQAYGCDLTCYDDDGGDCADGTTTTTTTTGASCDEVVWSSTATYDWYCTGSPGSASINFCANGTADFEGYAGSWTSGNGAVSAGDGLCPGTDQDSDLTFAFDNYATVYVWDTEGDDIYTPGTGYHDDQGYNGPDNVDGLTCINGGDCAGGGTTTTTGGTTTGGGCPDGYVEDCVDDDCCPESWIGDGFEDCEDQAYGCDLTCYDNDGGDCDGGGGTTTTTTTGASCDEVVWSSTATYDWYCTGSPGSASINFCANGTADFEGYAGSWTSGNGAVSAGDGLCPGTDQDSDLTFAFDNYATVYVWDTEGDDIYTPGTGYHDDQGYNGPDNVDGLTCINGGDCAGGGTTTTTGGTTTGGGCPDGYVEDCVDDDCCPESWIGDGFEDCEDQAYGCDLTCYDNDGGDCAPECAQGDINCDSALDVIDVVLLVNAIIDGEGLDNGDMNGDGSLDVIDVVILVNSIINGEGRAMDAENATVIETANSLTVKGDGYIGGIQMTLSHDNGFELNLTDNAMVAEYKTTGTNTILVVVEPGEELIFTSNQSFEIVDMIIANSYEEIEVNTIGEFGLSAAYPNPFNPSTSVTLHVPSADYVSVKVYNLVGQVVGVLADGMMDANTYTLTWNASDMSSGVYLVRAESGSSVDIQKVLLVK